MKDLCLVSQHELFKKVQDEHHAQIAKWGVQDRHPFEWLAFALEELGETSDAISEWFYRGGEPEHVVKEAIQTATLCIKIAEMFNHIEVNND